jgi:hypothetical protein
MRAEIISSLWRQGVASDVTRMKHQLYKLKEVRKDHILNTGDNLVLRLPFNNCGLSQLELAWTKVKSSIRANNMGTEPSLNHFL